MRSRNREINIFNMSLLDILTGMLGAFLFLMLGLVPYYERAKNNTPSNAPTTPQIDTLLNVVGQWNSNQTMNIYLYDDNGWCGINTKTAPLPKGVTINNAACNGDTGWQNASDYAYENKRYLIAYSIDGTVDPAAYQQAWISMELMALQSKTDGSGVQSFCPRIACATINPSGSKPNVMYGAYWVTVTKDASKTQFYQQWSFNYSTIAPNDLPTGVQPMPAPIVMTSAPVPTATPPSLPPTSTVTPTPTAAPAPAPTSQPNHSSVFDWLFNRSSPKSK